MNLVVEAEKAIQTFYHCQNPEERSRSHQWLLQLQKSPEAWQISWLLLDARKTVECQYYGAVILHFKICNMINEVSENDLEELRLKLITLISAFGSGLKFVLSKLCSTFAALIIQTAKEDFTLSRCLEQVNMYLHGVGCEPKSVTLQILTELPSQFKNIHMDSNRRIFARSFMGQFIEPVVSMWKEIMLGTSNGLKSEVLSCMVGWIEFGVSVVDCIDLIPLMLSHVETDELSQKVCEVITEMLTAPSSYSLQSTIFEILHQILQLEPLIDKAMKGENEEFINNTCMMISNIGETHSNTIIAAKDASQQMISLNLIKLILRFSSMPGHFPVDETSSKLTLTFWYHLQDDLLSVDVDDLIDYHRQFHEAFIMLVDVYFTKAQYPPDSIYQKYNSDDKEQFRCYRIDVQDTIMYLNHTLRDRCLIYFTQKLTDLLSASTSTWQQFESILFLLAGITGSVDTEDSVYLPNIIQLLKKVPDHSKTRNTMVTFLGGLAEWLNSHPEYIGELIPFLLSGILNKETSNSCSLSLQDTCQDCALLLGQDTIKKILQTCREALQTSNCTSKVVRRLFQISGYVISALPQAEMSAELEVLVTPLLQQFRNILESKNTSKSTINQLCQCLYCFQALYRSLDPYEELNVHPIYLVYQQMINLFPLLKDFCKHENLILAATSCICKPIEIVRESIAPLINLTCQILYEFFTIHPQGSILDVSSLVIGMFGSEEATMETVKQFFTALVNSCLNITNVGNEQHPNCMISLMDLLRKVIRTVPEFLFYDADLQMAFMKCALGLLAFQEDQFVRGTCNFLITYINHVSVYASGKEILLNFGRDLVCQILLCIGVTAPRHLTDNYAEVLLALNKNFVTQLVIWFKDIFSNDSFPTATASPSQKEQFQKAVLREKSSKSRMRETVKNFALVCRGLQGMPHIT